MALCVEIWHYIWVYVVEEQNIIQTTAEQSFGVTKHWVDKERFVMISDIERTIIDGLRHPAFVGGITEVAKGICMQRHILKIDRLVDYSRRLGNGAVVRRLGHCCSVLKIAVLLHYLVVRAGNQTLTIFVFL